MKAVGEDQICFGDLFGIPWPGIVNMRIFARAHNATNVRGISNQIPHEIFDHRCRRDNFETLRLWCLFSRN
jgi:hypothetical protein